MWDLGGFPEFSNIPLEHTPDPQPTVYEGIPFIWGFRDSWGMLQGYVGIFLEGFPKWSPVLALKIFQPFYPREPEICNNHKHSICMA